uniref:Uncharacterized protein n=1 Tax=Lepeophtheirus salmonis TaxID=72036 RepID=A0A0K2VFI0_LEPSM
MTKELRDSQVIKKSGVSLKCPGYIFIRIHRI